MSIDLTCPTCKGTGEFDCPRCDETHPCPRKGCDGSRRLPTLDEWDALKAERDALREVHTAAWGIIWALSPHAHHTLNIEGARIALKAACEKAQAARAALDSEGGETS